jgi:hypothetical protein
MKPLPAGVALIAAALVLTGCSQTVSGHGSPGDALSQPPGSAGSGPAGSSGPPGSSAPSSPGASSGSTSAPAESSASPPPAAHLACPHVVDPSAGLAYNCIVGGMTETSNSTWPVKFEREVDVQWTMDEGSGPVRVTGSPDLATVARALSTMMATSNYGPSPGIKKEKDIATTVDGKKAHLVQTLMTIDPAYRAKRGLRVTDERLWIVAVQTGANRVAAWYVSVPSVQQALWTKVPNLIRSIKVV